MLGVLGSVFGVLGIFTFGLLFVPLGLLCTLFSFVKREILLGLVSLAVNIVAIFVSPTIWLAFFGAAAMDVMTATGDAPQHRETRPTQIDKVGPSNGNGPFQPADPGQDKMSPPQAAQHSSTNKSLPYLFEQIEKPAYKKAFEALFVGESDLEPWLARYIADRNGVDAPGAERQVQGVAYETFRVCQPHSCPENVLYVVFDQGGSTAWALFTKDDHTSRFFGNPDPSVQTILGSLHE